MKDYIKPSIIEEEFDIVDIIAKSFGNPQPGDREVTDFWDE